MEAPQFHAEKFSSPEEELAYLRSQVAERERELAARGAEIHKDDIISDKIRDYSYTPTQAVLHETHRVPQASIQSLALNLSPEPHDTKMAELVSIVQEKGIKNALSVVEAMNDPHVEDDFHRFLVQYVKKGYEVTGLSKKSELFAELSMTLYEVSLPDAEPVEKEQHVKEVVSAMEQFYAGMLAVETSASGKYMALEIANPNHSEEFIFYVSVPDEKKDLFEKQILSLFPYAKIQEVPDDYNIFNEGGVTVGSYAAQKNHAIFPLKTYAEFDHDPLNVILNTFSKIKKDGEGAALQVIFRPPTDYYIEKYKRSLELIQKGEKVKKALPRTFAGDLVEGFKDVFFGKSKEQLEKDKDKPKVIDDIAVEAIKQKISTPMLEANIRIIASANTESEAHRILSDIESAFNQFHNTKGNSLVFKRLTGSKLRLLEKEFSFRAFSTGEVLPLNLAEITSILHFPGATIKSSPQLKQNKASGAAAPVDLPASGTLLGVNKFRNLETKIYMAKEDRLRHFYTIGQTGTGKSTLLKNMIAQDIAQGEGVCMIDPHGVDIMDILATIPPERYEDVIYFDPAFTARPMALNMLEFDPKYPEQKTFVVNELFGIFKKLYGAVPESMGPAFEQYFRNSAMLVMEDPDTGNTLLDVSRVLSDKAYRELKLSRCKNPLVKQFWENAIKTTGDQGLANYVQYVTNKFDVFLANDIMRPIVSQENSSFNFREIMDQKKIFLVNLSKGRLGDINANLIGLIIVGKFLMAALSRADSLQNNLPPFYLYIDEFQNVTTDSIATILSEARKYKLSLNIAHQYIKQLEENIKNAVFGNVGSLAVFRVGADDAEYLEKQFEPVFSSKDIINIENRNAYLKLLVNGVPVRPFNIETLPPPQGKASIVDKLKELSYLKYGRERADVEEEIMEKYKKAPAQTVQMPQPSR